MAAFDIAPFVAKGGPAALAVLMRLLETLRDKGVLTSDECKQILEDAAQDLSPPHNVDVPTTRRALEALTKRF
jgi:Mrp family chromosome partitioning ATPase